MSEDKDTKLKDLAQSLSEELGADATLSGPPPEVATGQVSVKPESPSPAIGEIRVSEILGSGVGAVSAPMDPVAPAPEPPQAAEDEVSLDVILAQAEKKPEKKEEAKTPAEGSGLGDGPTISFEELDKILKDQDPAFYEDLDAIKKDISEVTGLDLKAMHLDSEILKDSSKTPEEANLLPLVPLSKKVKTKFSHFVEDTTERIENAIDLVIFVFKNTKTYIAKAVGAVQVGVKALTHQLSTFGKWFQSRSVPQKLQFFVFISSLLGLSYFVKLIVTGSPIMKEPPPLYLKSFEPVADRVTPFSVDEELELFDSPLRQPEFVVLLKRMRVNLKPTAQSSKNPMAAFEVYVDAASQEVAIELKDRELEMQDVIARVFESMPYDEITEYEGKNKLKLILRRDLNRNLSKGRVKKVYFKTLFYKR
jgi:flagellar basal body-associated protein FliL